MTSYIRYSQVQVGDRVKLVDGHIWRDRRTAETHPAPFAEVAAVDSHRRRDVSLTTITGLVFSKPKTSKALVDCAYCAPDEECALHCADCERPNSRMCPGTLDGLHSFERDA